jgi:hypothetical protein
MQSSEFRWGSLLVGCLRELRESRPTAVPFVDWEVVPRLDERPDGAFVWFICKTSTLRDRFRLKGLPEATDRLRTIAVEKGFPADAAATIRTDATSLEDIEAGGGRFYFFR